MKEKIFSKQDTNAVKGLAILFMMYHHCFMSTDRFSRYTVNFFPLSQKWGVLISSGMKICVGMFVFLSAYGMTVSLKRKKSDYQLTVQETVNTTTARLVNMMSGYMFLFVLMHIISAIIGKSRFTEVYGTGLTAGINLVIDFLGLSDVMSTPTYLSTWWYMSVAVILVLAFPLLVGLYRKLGFYAIFLTILLPYIIDFKYKYITVYFLAMILGVVFADGNWLVRLTEAKDDGKRILTKLLRFVAEAICLFLLFWGRNGKYGIHLLEIFDGLIPVIIILMAFEFVIILPGVRQVLCFLGKHSMNIFLTHNFFRGFWCPDFIYSFRSAYLIPLVLLGISLIFSIMVELLKKLICFERLTEWVKKKLRAIA